MNQEFISERNVYLDRDAAGTGRHLSHRHAPVAIEGDTAQQVAAAYLHRFGDLLDIAPDQLRSLRTRPSTAIEDAGVEYRFLDEKQQFDTVSVAFGQTEFGIPVWHAGVAVHVKVKPLSVLGSQSTVHPHLEVKKPSRQTAKRAESLKEKELAELLGLRTGIHDAYGWDHESLKIEGRSLVIYRYDRARRLPQIPPLAPADAVSHEHHVAAVPDLPTLPVPPVTNTSILFMMKLL